MSKRQKLAYLLYNGMINIPLFVGKKDFFALLGVVVCIALFSLSLEFYRYKHFILDPLHVSKATVLNHYQKTNDANRTYDVLKLKLDESGVVVYTTSWRHMNLSFQDRVKIKFNVETLSFKAFLKGFYVPSRSLYSIYEDHPPFNIQPLYRWVKDQHSNELSAELYQTLFFATPISKELREEVQKWGISHLIAISGYHVGVISFFLFLMLKPVYQFFQNRYFPYRNSTADLTLIVLVVLFFYMVILGFIPSFLRAFTMSVIGFFLYSRGVKVLSFETLGLTVIALLALFPTLFFSISFWFSVTGVFYVFLFLHHFSHLNRLALLGVMDVCIFLLMIPLVHTFFPVFTFLQLTTPVSSLLFIVFYPLSFFLHVINYGGILDGYVLDFLHVKAQSYPLIFTWWFLGGYTVLSLLAIRFRFLIFICLSLSMSSLIFIE